METAVATSPSSLSNRSMDLSPLLSHHRSKPPFPLQNPLVSAKFKLSAHAFVHRCLPSTAPILRSFPPFALSQRRSNSILPRRSRRRQPISAAFERFTERAIKSVIFSQREAMALEKDMVLTQHLLLGLIAEDRSPEGYLGSGITITRAREAVRSIWKDSDDPSTPAAAAAPRSATDIPFSVSTKRVFEAAVEYSKTMGYNFIAPEHISIGLFTVDDGSATRVLER